MLTIRLLYNNGLKNNVTLNNNIFISYKQINNDKNHKIIELFSIWLIMNKEKRGYSG